MCHLETVSVLLEMQKKGVSEWTLAQYMRDKENTGNAKGLVKCCKAQSPLTNKFTFVRNVILIVQNGVKS